MKGELTELALSVPGLANGRRAFSALGFDIDHRSKAILAGTVQVLLDRDAGSPYGLRSWTFLGERSERVRLDPRTAPPTYTRPSSPESRPNSHRNGVTAIDHVVTTVPSLDALVGGLEAHVGASSRKRGEIRGLQVAFVKAGNTVLELIEMPSLQTPQMWGIAFRVHDLDKCVTTIREEGGAVGDPQPSLQGGRIASSPPQACFGVNLAFIEPG